ncbi:type II secretion system protein J [Paucisalibacillus sp. EB02]|uniref:PulJ/GspJ family protein n=1 Tax=Paucisalibacillus sp. EB02 TaxID=1347087 RepID=UPI0004BB74A3|nr:type II secretion system protein [Paucisalibacillus sp. EB02]
MNKSHLSNEKGVTLIELLAAIGLLAVVIVLSSSALTQLIGNKETVSNNNSLNQEVNVALNELRNQYDDGKDLLCITKADIQFTFVDITNGTPSENCIEVDPAQDTLSFTLTALLNGNQKEFKTAFEKKTLSYSMELLSGNKPPNEFTEEDDISGCIFEENTKFNSYVNISTNGNQNRALCDGEFHFLKNAAFFGGLEVFNHNTITVNENMYVFGNNFTLGNHVRIIIKGNLYIQSQEYYKPNAKIEVEGKVCKVEDINNIKSCEIELFWD